MINCLGSGGNGSVAKSVDAAKALMDDGGGYEKRDFRDIEALMPTLLLLWALQNLLFILKTKMAVKAGTGFEDTTKGMFLDAWILTKKVMGCARRSCKQPAILQLQ